MEERKKRKEKVTKASGTGKFTGIERQIAGVIMKLSLAISLILGIIAIGASYVSGLSALEDKVAIIQQRIDDHNLTNGTILNEEGWV